jgi:site-specific recombinase XerD
VTWLTHHDVTTAGGITIDLLRAYIADVQGRGLAPKTVHHHAAAAKTFCKWLAAEGLTPTDVAERLPRPKVPKKVLPALTKDDAKKLLDACENERDRALLLFMLDTGARCAETVAVNVGDVDAKTGAVTIAKGKGQKGRVVFLGVQSRRALSRYLLTRNDGPDAPLWTSERRGYAGDRLTRWGVTLLLKRMGDRAGVHVHPHMVRRTMAIWSLRAGMDIARLAALLGHSDLATVRKYLALVDADLADAHREHGAVDGMLGERK